MDNTNIKYNKMKWTEAELCNLIWMFTFIGFAIIYIYLISNK